ncbi:hypothetical protein C7451_12317 [Blastomonas natatoria]|uniref:Uncharacterized protein n=1 Tax=Blastomonas natatoria TaxID=34015 RepID=A0A2V3UPF4_9SPHN|nr:hypothetical protein [Blastomonas natatoria]PXW67881.1 hypothetical protein C7451_12317 [Blastomonas natatoria]
MTNSNPNPAWPLPSEGENAEESCIPPTPHLELAKLSIRERAFDAAQRLILSQPHMAVGRLEQNRLADSVIEMAERFEGWMRADPTPDLRTFVGDIGPFSQLSPTEITDHPGKYDWAATETDDPAIDDYIASDNRVIAVTEKLIADQRHLSQRMIIAEGKIENLLLRAVRPQR